MTGTGVLVMAYGTPRRREDIGSYYTDIRRGRPPSDEQLADLTKRYDAIGGLSPLAERTGAQRAAIAAALDAIAPGRYDVMVGLRHSEPSIEAAVADLVERGAVEIVGLVLAPHYSSMSVAVYLERAGNAAAAHGVPFHGIESWATEPAYVEFLADSITAQRSSLPAPVHVVFTAHSLPQRIIDSGDRYPRELQSTARATAAAAGLDAAGASWSIAWQSAGRTPERWVGPDLGEVIDTVAADGTATSLLVCPCGFVADHLEVLHDVDIDARSRADRAGLTFARTESVNDDGRVMAALADRIASIGSAP